MQNELSEGPRGIVEIRNALVHSDMQHGILCTEVYAQARELGLWYVELMLLYFIDYPSIGQFTHGKAKGNSYLGPRLTEGAKPRMKRAWSTRGILAYTLGRKPPSLLLI